MNLRDYQHVTEIEDAIIQALKHVGFVGMFRVADDPALIQYPSFSVSVSGGTFSVVGRTSYKLTLAVLVTVVARNLAGNRDRRGAIWPLVEAAVAALTYPESLPITRDGIAGRIAADPLMPVRVTKVAEDAERIAYTIEFKTAVAITGIVVADDDAADLATVGMDYMHTPGDETPEVTAEVTIEQS
jgi:hypothetical protein